MIHVVALTKALSYAYSRSLNDLASDDDIDFQEITHDCKYKTVVDCKNLEDCGCIISRIEV